MIDQDAFTTNIPFHGSKGLIFIGEKIIVFRRDTNTNNFPLQIDLPGGGAEQGETPFTTFSREALEEFGVHITTGDVEYARQYPAVVDPSKKSFFFVTRPKNLSEEDIIFGGEGIEWFTMSPQEFITLDDGVERQQIRVREYLMYIDSLRN